MRIKNLKNKIIIGTAQLLDDYGISNFVVKRNRKEHAISLINYCLKNNLNKFDTAIGYNSEKFLGNFFKNYNNKKKIPRITTKINSLKNFEDRKKISEIKKSINLSYNRLKFGIDTMLFHDQRDIDFVKRNIDPIKKIFEEHKIKKFGFSLYDLKFFNKIKELNYNLTIQVPTNVINDTFLKYTYKKNFNVVGRSLFLQGVLTSKKIKKGFKKEIYKSHQKYISYINKNSLNTLNISTSIIKSQKINSFVIGVDTVDQLKSILSEKISLKNNNHHIKKIKKFFSHSQLYDPRKW